MRKSRTELLVTTVLFSSSLARDDPWYVSLAGEVSEIEDWLPIGKMPDFDDGIIGYTFGTFDNVYDFPGFKLSVAEPLAVVTSTPARQLRIDRLAHRYHDRCYHQRSFWS